MLACYLLRRSLVLALPLGLLAGCTSEPIVHHTSGSGGSSTTAGGHGGSGGASTGSGGTESGAGGTSSSTGGGGTAPELHLTFDPVPLEQQPGGLTDFVFLPDGTELLALAKDGEVFHFRLAFNEGELPSSELLGSFVLPRVETETDCGAISLVVDNDFEKNQLFYVAKCTSRNSSGVFRYQFDASDYSAIAATESAIVEAEEPLAERAWHNVGSLNMDADGNLWVPFGDKTIGDNAQDRTSNLGALLRIVPNRERDGSGHVPAMGNPFQGGQDGSEDVYAYGMRSPWRAILDQEGRPWFGDVGSYLVEEINVVEGPGQNFGWANAEGVCVDDCVGLTDPVAFWDRDPDHDYIVEDPEAPPTPARVPMVAMAYRAGENDRYAGLLSDKVIFSDACLGFLRALKYTDHVVSDEAIGHLRTLAAMHQGADGHIYALTFGRCQTDQKFQLDDDGGFFRAVLGPRAP